VTALERRGQTVAVQVSGRPPRVLRARVVVAADGSNSYVGRVVRKGRVPRGDRIIALRGYFEDVAGPPGRAELFFSRDSFPGYCWVFPTELGRANVGIGMLLETFPPQTTHLREVLARLLATDPAVRGTLGSARPISKLVGWPLTTYNPHLPLASDGLLLVGDAAGLINPINGEGIQYALASARWAAEVLVAAADSGGFSHSRLEPYERRVAAELRLDMALARVISRLIANRLLNPFWLLALRAITARGLSDPGYAERAGGILVGLHPTHRAAQPDFALATVESTALALARAVGERALRGDPAAIVSEIVAAVVSSAAAKDELIAWARSSASEMAEFALGAAEAAGL
jgi:flavin-dependent dehydrogenase